MDMTSEIVERARLKLWEPHIPPPGDDEPKKKRKLPGMVRTVEIGPYQIRGIYRDDSCNIRLYQWFEGRQEPRKAFIAYRIAFGKQECDLLFKEVIDIVNQVRFEWKTLWRKQL